MPPAAVPLIGSLVVIGLILTGCGRQVAVEPPSQPPAICSALVAGLPPAVDGAGQRPTTPDSPATAAWGEPPIVLRCGVSPPAALSPTSVLLEVDGIGWLPEPLEAGTVFTAVEFDGGELGGEDASTLFIEVVIPQAYASPGGIIADISSGLRTSG